MPDNFFALLENGTVRKIVLSPQVAPSIQIVFVDQGTLLIFGKETIEFDGGYAIEIDEVLYVTMTLPVEVTEVEQNSIGIPILDLQHDRIKALFWYENGIYYFQNFDHRKLLQHRFVLFSDQQTFNQLTQNAFIVDNTVNAMYLDGKLYFTSYANANKIFSLQAFYQEATNEELTNFSGHNAVAIADLPWFLENANTVIRKHVTLLQKSGLLDVSDMSVIKRRAKKFKLSIALDGDGKIIFPQNTKACKDILYYLNEQFYEGPISGQQFKTNSKRLMHN